MTPEDRFWAKVDASGGPDACWPWTASIRDDGYGRFWYGGARLAHAVAWELAHDCEVPDGLEVCHRCPGGPRRECVNPAHLEADTASGRVQDSIRRNTYRCPPSPPGETNQNAKLTDDEVIRIRQLRQQGVTLEAIAELFGVHQSNVCMIARRWTWRHIPVDIKPWAVAEEASP